MSFAAWFYTSFVLISLIALVYISVQQQQVNLLVVILHQTEYNVAFRKYLALDASGIISVIIICPTHTKEKK
jgi:hypothetical protein